MTGSPAAGIPQRLDQQLDTLRAADPGQYPQVAALAASVREPSGLQRWSELWRAPIPDYAPGFLKNPVVGYIISALLGVGVVAGIAAPIGRLASRRRARRGFVERTLAGLGEAFERSLHGEESGARSGLLQGLDPRVKLVGLLLLIVAATASRSLAVVQAGKIVAAGTPADILADDALLARTNLIHAHPHRHHPGEHHP